VIGRNMEIWRAGESESRRDGERESRRAGESESGGNMEEIEDEDG
jgi:hypothetical protein